MAPRGAPESRAVRQAPGEPGARIGVFGGTFDPPHVGHLWLATAAADAMGLDRVLVMPAAQPPHKGDRLVTRVADRMLLTRLAIQGDPLFALSGLEMERPGPSYTLDSVLELKRLHPDDELWLVMAADSLDQIDTWHEPDRLLDEIEWIVGPRPGFDPPDLDQLRERFGDRASRIHLITGPSLAVSSSEIRRRVAAGEAIRYLVPRDVEELIIERGLYRRG
ncbi:MAG: nicotinate-nucleotide adenylyltransferase [Candidatus Limnocylindria bacterium]